MDKEEYLHPLAEASINDATKFRLHYHPLTRKEKELESIVRRILPTPVADSAC